MKKKIFYISIFLICIFSSNISAEHATLIDLGFDCESNSGFAEFELEGNPSHYDYYWSNGATTLRIENVPKGIYTFTVIDLLGCKEEIEVNIFPDVDYLCVADYTIVYDPINCLATITLSFTTEDNTVAWHDGYIGGMTRTVDMGPNDIEYCATITSNLNGCCYADICATVLGNPKACSGQENYKNPTSINTVDIYPNPFQESFKIDVKSESSGKVKISLKSSTGQTQSRIVVDANDRYINTYTMKTKPNPGIKFLVVEFPNGEQISTKIIQLK